MKSSNLVNLNNKREAKATTSVRAAGRSTIQAPKMESTHVLDDRIDSIGAPGQMQVRGRQSSSNQKAHHIDTNQRHASNACGL
tara:strand:+ start:950 stop:1198 length:249 start_codon:yes stop_codon:yes gene_type:complete